MSKYNVGDELRIREWDDMENEFGTLFGSIQCKHGFPEEMRYMCGSDFTVSHIDTFSGEYFSAERIEYTRNHGLDHWAISEDMLEPRPEEPLYVASDNELNSLLNI